MYNVFSHYDPVVGGITYCSPPDFRSQIRLSAEQHLCLFSCISLTRRSLGGLQENLASSRRGGPRQKTEHQILQTLPHRAVSCGPRGNTLAAGVRRCWQSRLSAYLQNKPNLKAKTLFMQAM